jgi:hypothetical protein
MVLASAARGGYREPNLEERPRRESALDLEHLWVECRKVVYESLSSVHDGGWGVALRFICGGYF